MQDRRPAESNATIKNLPAGMLNNNNRWLSFDLNFTQSMLVMVNYALENVGDIYDWNGYYNSDRGKALLHAYEVLEQYGWTFQQDDDIQLINETHELFVKKTDDV